MRDISPDSTLREYKNIDELGLDESERERPYRKVVLFLHAVFIRIEKGGIRMKITVSSNGADMEKHLLRVPAEVALETGRAEADAAADSCGDMVQKEVCDGEASSRILPCID